MAVQPAVGFPDYSRSGSSRLIPEIWSKKLLVKYYAETVWTEIANTDYEGEIKGFGERVEIRGVPTVSINNYQPGQQLVYPNLTSPYTELVINSAKNYSFAVNRVIERQTDIKPLMNVWAEAAARDLKVAVDQDVLANIVTGADAANFGVSAGKISAKYNFGASGSPITMTAANVIQYITQAGNALDEQNVPSVGRWMVVPNIMAGILLQSDIKNASITGDQASPLRNGKIGAIDRFTIYASNNLSTSTESGSVSYNILYGQKDAVSFAAQIMDAEVIKNPNDYGDLVRGLIVYGYKVIKPEGLGVLYSVF